MSEHARPPRRWISALCVLATVVLLVACWVLAPRPSGEGEAFAGTDATASAMLEEAGVTPWFQPLFAPGSGEIESGLFALQAAAGAGLFGYAVGRLHGRRRGRREADSGASSPASEPTGSGV